MGRHGQEPASGHSVAIRTTDPDAAREEISRTFARHEMRMRDGRSLDFRLDLAPSGRVTLGRLRYGADVVIDGPPMRLCYHVNLPVTGWSTAGQRGIRSTVAACETGVLFRPDAPLTVRWSPDATQYVVKLPKELLEAHAARLAGHPLDGGLDPALTFDLAGGPGRALLATAGFLYAELERPGGLATMPAARQEMESALMTQLLMTVPSRISPALHGRPAHTTRSRVREAMDHVDMHPDLQLSTADLAAVAGIGVRALQAGFREVAGMSPTAYVRTARLDRVHLELGSGTGRPVSEVAARWGFFHPGRFATWYRDRFGELPSATARRS
ncbi:AraC family transcriptional regulator [Pseudonocardia sp. C8]|uniref:AraC family transcriptional regulator n=1 Tax=Pseudonocardia sp. C8 TaxID=2762759 RepID=UPI001C92C7B5|nr:AraC family transcriptional regulator [Pseudonocardia sp. C8]